MTRRVPGWLRAAAAVGLTTTLCCVPSFVGAPCVTEANCIGGLFCTEGRCSKSPPTQPENPIVGADAGLSADAGEDSADAGAEADAGPARPDASVRLTPREAALFVGETLRLSVASSSPALIWSSSGSGGVLDSASATYHATTTSADSLVSVALEEAPELKDRCALTIWEATSHLRVTLRLGGVDVPESRPAYVNVTDASGAMSTRSTSIGNGRSPSVTFFELAPARAPFTVSAWVDLHDRRAYLKGVDPWASMAELSSSSQVSLTLAGPEPVVPATSISAAATRGGTLTLVEQTAIEGAAEYALVDVDAGTVFGRSPAGALPWFVLDGPSGRLRVSARVQGTEVSSAELVPTPLPGTGPFVSGTVSPAPEALAGPVYVLAAPVYSPGSPRRVARVAVDGRFRVDDLEPGVGYAFNAFVDEGARGVIERENPRALAKHRLAADGGARPVALTLMTGPVRVRVAASAASGGESVDVYLEANRGRLRGARLVSALGTTAPVGLTVLDSNSNFFLFGAFPAAFLGKRLDVLFDDGAVENLRVDWPSAWPKLVTVDASRITADASSVALRVPIDSHFEYLVVTLVRDQEPVCRRVVAPVSQTVSCSQPLSPGAYRWEVLAMDEDGQSARTGGPPTTL